MIPSNFKKIAKKILALSIYSVLAHIVFAPKRFVEWLYNRRIGMKTVRYIEANRDEKIILLAGIHEWGNLGDHAICIAEREFLERNFPSALIVELSTKKICPVAERISAVHCNHLVVAVPGGGFLGNLWPSEEKMFRKMLKTFAHNRIVVLPQSIFFDKNEPQYKRELNRSINAYNAHPNVHFFIRDKSIEFLKTQVLHSGSSSVYSVPDLVLSLDRSQKKFDRHGILLCFRSDKEKTLDSAAYDELVKTLRQENREVRFTDTCIDYCVPPELRTFAVEKKFDEFRQASLVITDRLHGMIFSCITGTPCIALNNISKKVQGVYDLWLSGIPYIAFAKDIEAACALIPKMSALGGQVYDPTVFSAYWQQIASVIEGGFE